MVRVPVAAVVPAIVTEDVTPQVGAVMPPGGFVSAQVRLTVPVNPFDGVTVIVEVFPDVAPAVTVTPPLLESAMAGEELATCARRFSVWTYSPVVSFPIIAML
jgi:hypothetical protein